MGISRRHLAYHREVFSCPGFFAEPTLVFGYQELNLRNWPPRTHKYPEPIDRMRRRLRALRYRLDALRGAVHADTEIPEEYRVSDFPTFLKNHGIRDFEILDFYDKRATLRHDMNIPIPRQYHEHYGTFLDIGCLEHVFDTRQCLENCLRMVRPGGHYFLHTPVNGYFRHGLHVFNPDALVASLELNGFEIVLERYSSRKGKLLHEPSQAKDALIWLVGRKTRVMEEFRIPQQEMWQDRYRKVGQAVR